MEKSNDTDKPCSHGPHEILGERIDALDRLIQVQFESLYKEIGGAKEEMDRRLAGMNDLQSRFRELITRPEYAAAHENLIQRFEQLIGGVDKRVQVLERTGVGFESNIQSRITTTRDFVGNLIPIGAMMVSIAALLYAVFHKG